MPILKKVTGTVATNAAVKLKMKARTEGHIDVNVSQELGTNKVICDLGDFVADDKGKLVFVPKYINAVLLKTKIKSYSNPNGDIKRRKKESKKDGGIR